MAYCHEGLLQSSIDAELTVAEQRELDAHLHDCHNCRQRLAEMTAMDSLTKEKMTLALPESQVDQAWHSLNQRLARKQRGGGILYTIRKHRPAFTVAATLIFVLATVLVTPVRDGLAAFLHLFRVNQLEAVTFTVEDLQQIQNQFYGQGTRDIDLRQFGQLKLTGGEAQHFSREDLSILAEQSPFPFKMPVTPEKFSLEAVSLINPTTIELVPSVGQINQLIKAAGGSLLLPQELDGKSFTISSSGTLQFVYVYPYPQAEENRQGQQHLSLKITAAPEILVPEGIDVNALREVVLSLPFIPQSIRRQLVQIEDWQTTLPIPVGPGSLIKEVFINDHRALYIYEKWGGESTGFGHLVWGDDQKIYVLSSGLSEEELLAVARSL